MSSLPFTNWGKKRVHLTRQPRSIGSGGLECCAEDSFKATGLSRKEFCHRLVTSAIGAGGERNDVCFRNTSLLP